MSHVQPPQALVSAANTMLTPTYWGSLAALLVGILLSTVSSLRSGLPQHVVLLGDQVAAPIFYSTLVFVALFTVRYYCAVCVNIYGGSMGAIFEWPRGAPRKLAFLMLCVLVLLSVSSVGAVIALGVALSLLICLMMATISFLMFFASWLLSHVDTKRFGAVSTPFGVGDLCLILLTGWAFYSVSSGPSETTVIGFPIFTAVFAMYVAVEFKRRYWERFRDEYQYLREQLEQ